MHLPRRLTVTLSAAALALGAAGPAWAQSAGDEQYSDPLAQTDTGGGSKTTTGSGSTPSLTATPSGQSTQGTSGSGSTAPCAVSGVGTATAPATASAQLPRTGADTLVVALLGAALVLFGIGLRLRVGDARR